MKVFTDEARTRIDRAIRPTTLLFAGAIASSALALLSGWLTGQSGPDPTVTAAAIPAILSIGGAVVFLRGAESENLLQKIGAAIFIVIFCGFFFWALHVGVNKRIEDLNNNLAEADEVHLRHLEACSKAQHLANRARAARGLEALSAEYFCRKVPYYR